MPVRPITNPGYAAIVLHYTIDRAYRKRSIAIAATAAAQGFGYTWAWVVSKIILPANAMKSFAHSTKTGKVFNMPPRDFSSSTPWGYA
eukprot:10642-Karenia_brevis.AAC.1